MLSAQTELNLNAPALKNGIRNYQNAKISNRVNMHIFDTFFSKASKVLPQWMCPTSMKSIKEISFFIYRINGAFFVDVARKPYWTITKNRILLLSQSPGLTLISLSSAPTVPNLKALTWKMAPGMTKMSKLVIGSVCAYLISCKSHYQYHELGTLDE